MATAPFVQTNFAGGYLSPELLGRTDTQKYQAGLAEVRNCIIVRTSGAQNRSGSLYVGATKDTTTGYRAVPFVLSNSNSFHLEFGNFYMRPWKNGARISVVGAAAWDVTIAYKTDGSTANLVTYLGAVYRCSLANVGNAPFNGSTFWDLQVGGLLEIKTTISLPSAMVMTFAQQNSIMTLASQVFVPQQLKRWSDTKWTTGNLVPAPSVNTPTGITVTAGVPIAGVAIDINEVIATGGNPALSNSQYVVWNTGGTAANASFPATAQGGVDATHSVVVSWTDLAGATGFRIYRNRPGTAIFDSIGTVGAGVTSFTDANLALNAGFNVPYPLPANVFQFAYVVTAVSDATGEESLPSKIASCYGNVPTTAAPNVVQWTPVPGATKYNVYLCAIGALNPSAAFGFVGSVTNAPIFSDAHFIPIMTSQPPVAIPLFATTNDYPAVVGYFQQRLLLGNTLNQPQTVLASRVGAPTNFCVSTPLLDTDAIQFTISGTKVQTIQSFVDLGKLIVHTSNGEYVCPGNVNGSLTPTANSCVLQGGCGSSAVAPVVIGNTDIFIQALGNMVRDLRFEIQSSQYAGKDISVYTPDLFLGRTVVQMAWQQVKNSIVWMVMSDGIMLSLTYNREEGMWCWGVHDTGNGDLFTQVIVIPEGTQEVVYFGVNRLINGVWTQGIEKLAERDFVDQTYLTDAYFPDCAQVYDGRNKGATTLTLTTAAGWTASDTYTLTASVGTFAAADAPAGNPQGAGNTFVLRQVNALGVDTARLYFTVTAYISATQVTVQTNAAVPTWARVALTAWGKAVHAFSGMSSLEGRTLSILGDGNVIASPSNPDFPTLVTVAAGAFVIPGNVNCMVVCAGLPVLAELTTLPAENQKGPTINGRQKNIQEIIPTFYASRGGLFGQLAPPGTALTLKPWKQRQMEPLAIPTKLFSGTTRINAIAGNWGAKGQGTAQAVVQQPDPLPLGLSAITLQIEIGD